MTKTRIDFDNVPKSKKVTEDFTDGRQHDGASEVNGRIKKWAEKHKEIWPLAEYPPFSTNPELEKEFRQDMNDYDTMFNWTSQEARKAGDPRLLVEDEPWSLIEDAYPDELEEARLYRKRYGVGTQAWAEAYKAYLGSQEK